MKGNARNSDWQFQFGFYDGTIGWQYPKNYGETYVHSQPVPV